MKHFFTLLLLSILLTGKVLQAVDTTAAHKPQVSLGNQPPHQAVKDTAKPAPALSPIQVLKASSRMGDGQLSSDIGLGEQVILEVKGINTLLARATPKVGPKQEIRLFINDRQIDGLNAIVSEPRHDSATIAFRLQRTADNDKEWTQLLGKPQYPYFFKRPAIFSVGIDKTFAENSLAKNSLIRVRPAGFVVCLIVVLGYFILLIYCAKKTPMLRDSVIDLAPLNIPTPGGLAPYSLGRMQMAFWFSVVLVCFFFIWLITGNYELITPGILGLIGISSGTALGAVAVDNGKTMDTITQIKALEQQESDLINKIATLQSLVPPAPTTAGDISFAQTQQQQVRRTINQLLSGLTLRTEGLRKDLLTDANGYSFHRLQMATWTIVLGIVFLYSVWAELTMPDFSATQLALQGITAGAYLGFKLPEKQS
jgi:hypothetical protein